MERILTRQFSFLIIIAAFACNNAYSQADTVKLAETDELSLKELLNVKIVSVSKKSELLFNAPLSASVVSREDIRRAGCMSVIEALRLVPGIIVREQSNGNYDIHLRGMDNVPVNAPFDVTSNTTTLVMIDNRPVYSYLLGGTFWETLPVDMNDLERIEVVRGCAAALYGPNAVNGVINIITRQTQKDGLSLVANSQQGSYHTFINNASVGYQANKFSMIASGNYQRRERTQTSYFEYNRNKLLDHPDYLISFSNDTTTDIDGLYPNPKLAMEKYAGNVFLSYDAGNKIKFNLSAGAQHSWVQRVSTENELTPLSNTSSNSRYVDFRANIKDLSAQVSYNKGTQEAEFDSGDKYDFNMLDANIEYSYTHGNLLLKPGLSYRDAIYDDTKYSDIEHRAGVFNTRGEIISKSVFLRGEYKLLDNKLRLIAGASTNTFNYPDSTYLAYNFAATYKINSKHLLRAGYSTAPRSSNVFDTYVDQALVLQQIGDKNFIEVAIVGNKNLKLLTANTLEIGYRGNISPRLFVEVELFDVSGKNYSVPVQSHPIIEMDGVDTVHETPHILTNLPLTLKQYGITVSFVYNSKKLQLKPFVTIQQTNTKNYAPFVNTPDANVPGAAQHNIYSGMGTTTKLKSTPTVFGGVSANYILTSKVNINMSAYYYSSQTYQHLANILFNDNVRGIDHINAKFILNANISYTPVKRVHFSVSAKNILNDKSREFFHTDQVPFMAFAGVNFDF